MAKPPSSHCKSPKVSLLFWWSNYGFLPKLEGPTGLGAVVSHPTKHSRLSQPETSAGKIAEPFWSRHLCPQSFSRDAACHHLICNPNSLSAEKHLNPMGSRALNNSSSLLCFTS